MPNLTFDEQERLAYIMGDTARADLLANQRDEEAEEQALADHGESEYSRGYADGKAEATDTDAAELQEKLEKAQLDIKTLTDTLKHVEAQLRPGGEYTTAANRRAAEKNLRTFRLVHGWY